MGFEPAVRGYGAGLPAPGLRTLFDRTALDHPFEHAWRTSVELRRADGSAVWVRLSSAEVSLGEQREYVVVHVPRTSPTGG